MKRKLTCTLLFCALFCTGTLSFAQSFEVPQNVQLETATDYAKYEQDVVRATDWLVGTNLDMERARRKEVGTFLVKWITGSPDITVELNNGIGDLYGQNTDLLLIYMAAYSKYCIQHKNAAKFDAVKAAVLTMAEVYTKGIRIEKTAEMEKFIKLNDAKRDKYIREQLFVH